MLDGQVLEASQVEYEPFGKTPLKRESRRPPRRQAPRISHCQTGRPPQHAGRLHGSIGLVQQSAGTLDLYSMQIRASAFEGESVLVTDLLANLLALTGRPRWTGSPRRATGCDQLLCNLHRRVHHGRGCLGRSLHRYRRRATLSSTGTMSGSLLEHHGGGQRGPAKLRHSLGAATTASFAPERLRAPR